VDYEYTQHARFAMELRAIDPSWVNQTLAEPELRQPDPDDPTVERFFRRIPARDNRVMRVAANTTVEPARVVSVFFDRTMKGKL